MSNVSTNAEMAEKMHQQLVNSSHLFENSVEIKAHLEKNKEKIKQEMAASHRYIMSHKR